VIRRHYVDHYPALSDAGKQQKKRPQRRHHQQRNPHQLGDRTREDLAMLIDELEALLADRDREIVDLNTQIDDKDREIAQLRNDLAWERAAKQQLEGVVTPPVEALPMTVKRPDGKIVEIVHAVSRASQEITPPLKYGQPDLPGWAKLVRGRTEILSALELHWLLADNGAHLDAFERAFPGAGIGLKGYINARIAKLSEEQRNP
jgi:hypothetical protein